MDDASNLQQNWTNVTVAWGDTTLAIPEVVDVEVDKHGRPEVLYADAETLAILISIQDKVRSVTIKGAALNVLVQIPEDTACIVTAILNDLNNGTGTGAITVTAVNAVLASNPFKGRNNELGTGSAMFLCYSPSGADPITYAVAP